LKFRNYLLRLAKIARETVHAWRTVRRVSGLCPGENPNNPSKEKQNGQS
jgi:hypothetical protein